MFTVGSALDCNDVTPVGKVVEGTDDAVGTPAQYTPAFEMAHARAISPSDTGRSMVSVPHEMMHAGVDAAVLSVTHDTRRHHDAADTCETANTTTHRALGIAYFILLSLPRTNPVPQCSTGFV